MGPPWGRGRQWQKRRGSQRVQTCPNWKARSVSLGIKHHTIRSHWACSYTVMTWLNSCFGSRSQSPWPQHMQCVVRWYLKYPPICAPWSSFSLSPCKQRADPLLIALGEAYGKVRNRNVLFRSSDPKLPWGSWESVWHRSQEENAEAQGKCFEYKCEEGQSRGREGEKTEKGEPEWEDRVWGPLRGKQVLFTRLPREEAIPHKKNVCFEKMDGQDRQVGKDFYAQVWQGRSRACRTTLTTVVGALWPSLWRRDTIPICSSPTRW